MTWFLIAAAIITGWTWAALRLHAGWAPPPEPEPLSEFQRQIAAFGRAAEESARAIGDALLPVFEGFAAAARRLQAALEERP